MAERTTIQTEHIGYVANYHAVWSGFIVAVALQLFLNVLGNAIGLALVSPASAAVLRPLSTGPVLWTLGIPLATFLIGGFVASAMAASAGAGRGVALGILVWGLGMILLAVLMTLGHVGTEAAAVAAGTQGNVGMIWWLTWFSELLALCGAAFGGYLGSRPLARTIQMHTLVERPA